MATREEFMVLASEVLHELDDLLATNKGLPDAAQSPTVSCIRATKEIVIEMRNNVVSAVSRKKRKKKSDLLMHHLVFNWPLGGDVVRSLERFYDMHLEID